MRRIVEWDAWLMAQSQRAYLWLLDRTGVYVATVGMLIYALGVSVFMFGQGKVSVVLTVILGLYGVILGFRYWQQDTQKNGEFNEISRNWSEAVVRRILMTMTLVIGAASFQNLFTMFSYICDFVFFGYVLTIQIRERTPPEKELNLAHQGAGR